MYIDWFDDHRVKTNCSQPCYSISVAISKTREVITESYIAKNKSKIKFYFEEVIKVNKAYYLYDAMSIISEVGGFINLIRLIRTYTEKFIKQIAKLMKTFFMHITSKNLNVYN